MPPKLKKGQSVCPMVPLKDMVLFPHMVVPLLIGRPSSLDSVDMALGTDGPLVVFSQREPNEETPKRKDLFQVGIRVQILQTLRLPDGAIKIVVEGLSRVKLCSMTKLDGCVAAVVEDVPLDLTVSESSLAFMSVVLKQFEEYAQKGQRVAPEIVLALQSVEDHGLLSDMVCAHIGVKTDERQALLEISNLDERLEQISFFLTRELELLSIEQDVRDRVREQMERGQREYFLTEQLRVIQRELGTGEFAGDDVQEIRQLVEKTKMPKEAKEKAQRELIRFDRMPLMTPESAIVQTYLEWLTDVPWSKRTKDVLDLTKAQKTLDEDHFGLEKVKERILEFLSVRKLSKSTRGPVMCLVGPPGVGKTSLGQSIARAMGRKFARISLGGVRDEAEIRGHRRTYIGAMPGRVIQSMAKCGVRNPVFMLDEIDKMAQDFRGDPASALLEVLDPEQNKSFSDHYLEVDYDLHEVFFVTTANSEYDIPEPLLDRMEIIRIPGYTPLEKEQIARRFLIPKQIEETGITDKQIKFESDGLLTLLQRYTDEAGVRELDRQIANVCRKVAHRVVTNTKKKFPMVTITHEKIIELLGPPIYSDVQSHLKSDVGVSVGLAWTSTGGDTLVIESTLMKGKGDLKLTGQLGEVMQESAQAAYTYLRANVVALKIPAEFWKNYDIHVHLPEGAIPKDGPSAGGALTVSMLSALRKKAPAAQLAMTGEITLRGRILPVGGVKEKVLAAHRAKIKYLILPKENAKDLVDIPKDVLADIDFKLVDSLEEVIEISFPKARKKVRAKRKATNKK
jgi:ATP-dependent Lon protease